MFEDIATSLGDFFNDNGMAVGVGLQAAGTLARKRALDKIRAEQERKRAEEAARQRVFRQQIDAQNAALLPQFTREASEAQRKGIAQQYEQYMQPTMASTDVGDYSAGVASAPKEVRERAERELAGAKKKGEAYTKAAANLSSYGGLDVAQRGALSRASNDIGRTVNASRSSAALLPYDLQKAYDKGRGLMNASDIANGLGSVSFLFGATAPRRAQPKPAPVPGSGLNLGLSSGEQPGEPGLNPRVRGEPGLRLRY